MANAAKKTDSKGIPVVSAAEIRRVAGPLNDETVAQIMRIGPSMEELEIAARYATGEGDLLDRMGHPLDGRVAQIYDILSAEEGDEEERAAPR
jgi:hypothetical protein